MQVDKDMIMVMSVRRQIYTHWIDGEYKQETTHQRRRKRKRTRETRETQ